MACRLVDARPLSKLMLFIGPIGTNFSEILIEIHIFSFKKMRNRCHFVSASMSWWSCIEAYLTRIIHNCFILSIFSSFYSRRVISKYRRCHVGTKINNYDYLARVLPILPAHDYHSASLRYLHQSRSMSIMYRAQRSPPMLAHHFVSIESQAILALHKLIVA